MMTMVISKWKFQKKNFINWIELFVDNNYLTFFFILFPLLYFSLFFCIFLYFSLTVTAGLNDPRVAYWEPGRSHFSSLPFFSFLYFLILYASFCFFRDKICFIFHLTFLIIFFIFYLSSFPFFLIIIEYIIHQLIYFFILFFYMHYDSLSLSMFSFCQFKFISFSMW